MTIKIKNLTISGIRGIKDSINLQLNEKSVLIYGENGSGKSSISDSIEWFYKDNVSHLSNTEIDLKDALRNSLISKTDISNISISYNKNLSASKKLYYKKSKLVSELINLTDDLTKYMNDSKNENLLLRYHLLRDFVDQTKSDKLRFLSDIIGFSDVTKTRDILLKTFNSIKNEIKNQNFEAQINTQKRTLTSKIGAAISQEKNFIEKINEIIKPLKLDTTVKSINDIDIILEHIKNHSNIKLSKELYFLETARETLSNLKNEINFIDTEYKVFFAEFNKIAADTKSIMQTFLSELLRSGNSVLENKYHKEDTCPLCLQPKNIKELKADITRRLKDIEESSKIKLSFDTAKQSLYNISTNRIKKIDIVLSNPIINESNYKNIQVAFKNLKEKLTKYQETTNKKVISGDKLPSSDILILTENDFQIQTDILEKIKFIDSTVKNDKTTEIYANISTAKEAFLNIAKFENEKVKLEHQKKSLELIYNEFVKQQKEGLENFINTFSVNINDFYQYMNPEELFQEIQIVTIGEEDDLKGIRIEYKYNNQWVFPPQKYFSESHLNCFGIAFFLASVIAFNKNNKFILFDDVISSFDTLHRKRFADLLFEKFTDYQIIVLTHESEWFNHMSQLAKRKGWLIDNIKWDEFQGAYLDGKKPADLKERIEKDLADGSIEDLGNSMRKYLEYILKNICLNLEVKVRFVFNDMNEKRMSDELLNELKSKINKSAEEDLKSQVSIIDRVTSSSILGNLLSHDNPLNHPTRGDLKAFWTDIKDFEQIFNCQDINCKKPQISIKNYDTVEKKIRCSCGKTRYAWKK
jgi:recombinational DNA repair ATPase RecF